MVDVTYPTTTAERSHQGQLPGLGLDGEKHVTELMEWREKNPKAWSAIEDKAVELLVKSFQFGGDGYISSRYLVAYAQNELFVQMNNNWSAALARVLMQENVLLRHAFRTRKSASDGYVS